MTQISINIVQEFWGINERANEKFDRFEILSKLGSGGFGSVFKIKDKFTQQISAAKKIKLKGNILILQFDINLIPF